MNSIVCLDNINKSYHSLDYEVKVINNISFKINNGEFVTIVGPSGCGKSTILNIISGLDKDYDGVVTFGEDISISYMTQEESLFPHLSILDNALIALKVKGKLNNNSINYVNGLLRKYGLFDIRYKKVSELSGGQKQRVSLVRTLSIKPNLILLDEAFSSLDYVNRLKISEDVYHIVKEENISALMVSHDIAEAISMSDRIIVLSNRPACIKKEYLISLGDSPIENRNNKDFNYYFSKIWEDINE